ncbi:hypothetical protein Plhal304r1_c052g0135961 [Plasmopara halstedii]
MPEVTGIEVIGVSPPPRTMMVVKDSHDLQMCLWLAGSRYPIVSYRPVFHEAWDRDLPCQNPEEGNENYPCSERFAYKSVTYTGEVIHEF